MRNYYLVFDYAQKRIGWGPVNRKAGGCGSIQEGHSVRNQTVRKSINPEIII